MTLAKLQTYFTGNNKTANIRGKTKKFSTACKVDYTYVTQN